ncbi:hypothetical protein [Streptomyces sp. TLI_171]|uniref:hypothetical protein n=1 Tax=Streptomyces sp. TLI_171 TaxID=1938859 RepID=UPI000C18E5D2|nr:hypothetical protein [Streptomyces sp. TLI_171]RKE19620.1 hypothetical protein BX266_2947 [Streptomyces sp. TLI_171]
MSEMVHTDPATGLPTGTVAAFLTLAAALVALYPTGGTTEHGHPEFRWLCLGCGDRGYYAEQRGTARNRANSHAAECRAIPWPSASA